MYRCIDGNLIKCTIYLLLCSIFWKLNGFNFKAHLLRTRICCALIGKVIAFLSNANNNQLRSHTLCTELLDLSGKFFSYRLGNRSATKLL